MATPADYLQQFISIINPEDDLTAEEVAQEIEEAKKKKVYRDEEGGWVGGRLGVGGYPFGGHNLTNCNFKLPQWGVNCNFWYMQII